MSNDYNAFIEKMREFGAEIDEEEIKQIIYEIEMKHSESVDINKMHPLTRAFVNLKKNKEKLGYSDRSLFIEV